MSVPATAFEVRVSEAVPDTGAASPRYTANANPVNTPPGPSGYVQPGYTLSINTGRSSTATQTFLHQFVIS